MAEEKSTRRRFLRKLGVAAAVAGAAPALVFEHAEAGPTKKKAAKKTAKKKAKKKAAKKKTTRKKAAKKKR